jgi:hypothetical protein
MKILFLSLAALGILLVLTVFAQGTGVTGWYNGEWQSGIPGLSNWYVSFEDYSRVYDQFQVPEGGWTVVAVFSDNGLYNFPTVVNASWEIRRGMVPGNGGTVIASGVAPAIVTSDPSVTAARYPASEVPKHFRIQVGNLNVQLPAGRHWVSVTPLGRGGTYMSTVSGKSDSYASATLGRNCVGIQENGLGIALFDRPAGPRFAIAESVGSGGQLGIARHFAQGVIISK